MVTIIFKDMTPVEVAGKILSEFGYFEFLKVHKEGEFYGYFMCYNDDFVHDYYKEKLNKGYHYEVSIRISPFSEKDSSFKYEPTYSSHYCSYGEECYKKYDSCLKFRDGILKFCKEKNINTQIFEKYDSIEKLKERVISTLKKLREIGIAEDNSYKDEDEIS